METVEITSWADYQKAAMRTMTESSRNTDYVAFGLIAEAGEVCGEIAKMIRDDNGELTDKRRENILKELGDVIWFVAGLYEVRSKRNFGDIYLGKIPWGTPPDLQNLCRKLYYFSFIVFENARADIKSDDTYPNSTYPVLKCVGTIATLLGSSLLEVCQMNIDKLTDRYNRGVIHGSGNDR